VGEVGEEKEEVERNPFYRLPLAETHHGDRNMAGKITTVVCSWHEPVVVDWVPREGAIQEGLAHGAGAASTQEERGGLGARPAGRVLQRFLAASDVACMGGRQVLLRRGATAASDRLLMVACAPERCDVGGYGE
jgi:hypothetical protein